MFTEQQVESHECLQFNPITGFPAIKNQTFQIFRLLELLTCKIAKSSFKTHQHDYTLRLHSDIRAGSRLMRAARWLQQLCNRY